MLQHMDTPAKVEPQFLTEEEFKALEKPAGRSSFKKEDIFDAFGEAFHLVGGVPRLALWAEENPSKFFPTLARMATSNAVNIQNNTAVVIRPALPPSPLDEE